MDRRDALRAMGSLAALPFFRGTAESALASAESLHDRLAAEPAAKGAALSAAHMRLVSSIADAILPRTDTPGASDVQVPQFIDLIVAEWATDIERRDFLTGLDEIDGLARRAASADFASLIEADRTRVMRELDAMRRNTSGAGYTFAQVKSLTVYGYFTSARVQREVLKTRMYFTHYDGNAPL